LYGVAPLFVYVVVAETVEPGVAVATSQFVTIVKRDTVTDETHRGSVLPLTQLFPSVDEVTVFVRMLLPVSVALTVAV
jgi:hypothetical protein